MYLTHPCSAQFWLPAPSLKELGKRARRAGTTYVQGKGKVLLLIHLEERGKKEQTKGGESSL